MEQLIKTTVGDFLEINDEADWRLQGACVIGYLERQLDMAFDPGWWENGELDEASEDLKKCIIRVLKYVGEVSENEDMVKDIEA